MIQPTTSTSNINKPLNKYKYQRKNKRRQVNKRNEYILHNIICNNYTPYKTNKNIYIQSTRVKK